MKSKLIALTIALIMCLTAFTACGLEDAFTFNFSPDSSKNASADKGDASNNSGQSVGSQSDGDGSSDQSGGQTEQQPEIEEVTDDRPDATEVTFSADMPALILPEKGHYTIDVKIGNSYFARSSYLYNKKIALLSFGLAVSTDTEDNLKAFFDKGGFDDDVTTYGYDRAPTEDSVACGIAKKTMGDYTLVAVAVRGFNYSAEWASNFTLGTGTGHKGFYDSADIVFNDVLKGFMTAKGLDYSSTKFLLTGYSRGGGIANVGAGFMNDQSLFPDVNKENLFAYTFEAPQGHEGKVYEKNVFNIVSGEDIVTYIAPSAYGLYRIGLDKQIFDADCANYVKQFDGDITLPELFVGGSVTSGEQIYTTFLNGLTKKPKKDTSVSVETKQDYYNNLQTAMRRAFKKLQSMTPVQKAGFTNGLKNNITTFLQNYAEEYALYDIVKGIFDGQSVTYNDDDLKTYTEQIRKVLASYLAENGVNAWTYLTLFLQNVDYIKAMHSPEVIYSLLINS